MTGEATRQADRWLVIAEEPFLPPDAGGRVEHLNFLSATIAAGIRPRVLIPTKDTLDVKEYERRLPGASVIALPRDDSPLCHLSRSPYVQASRPVGPLQRALDTTPPLADAVISYSCRVVHLGEAVARTWNLPHFVRAHNVDSEYFRVLARRSAPPRSVAYEVEYHKLRRAEIAMQHSPSVTCIADISLDDHEWRREHSTVPTMHLPPFLTRPPAGHTPSAVDRVAGRLLFVGSLDTPTNVEALRWFVDEAWPLVLRRNPEATLQIVGRRPEPGLVADLGGRERVSIATDVPDVSSYLASAAVSVNPMRSGSGVNIKVVDAMAAGLPVVSTSVGGRGLAWTPGRHLLVADSAVAFADAVGGLLDDPRLAARIGESGRDYVFRELDWDTLIGRIRAALATR